MSRFRKLFQSGLETAKKDPAFVLLHLGTATGLFGFCLTDPLPLRCCSITSSVASITFMMTRTPAVSMVPVYWSSCFIAVNSYKIYQLLMERRAVDLATEDEEIYVRHFMRSGMRPRQFKKLMEHASLKSFENGTVMHAEGSTAPSTVRLLINGKVQIRSHDEVVFTVDAKKPICFLGDTHVLEMADNAAKRKGKLAPGQESVPSFNATAVAMCPKDEKVVVLEWDNSYLVEVLTDGSETAHSLRAVLTNSMVQKLVDIGTNGAVDKYTTMMFACASDGSFNDMEKKLLSEYAQQHGVDEEGHLHALESIGWTAEEYRAGKKSAASGPAMLSGKMWGRFRNKWRHLSYEDAKRDDNVTAATK